MNLRYAEIVFLAQFFNILDLLLFHALIGIIEPLMRLYLNLLCFKR